MEENRAGFDHLAEPAAIRLIVLHVPVLRLIQVLPVAAVVDVLAVESLAAAVVAEFVAVLAVVWPLHEGLW